MAHAVGQIVWTTAPDGQVEDMPEWRAYTGQTAAAVRGWGWLDAVHPEDAARTQRVWQAAVEARGVYDTEYRIRGADGAYRWFQARGVPVLALQSAPQAAPHDAGDRAGTDAGAADSRILERVGCCLDVDAHRRAEAERATARAELEATNAQLQEQALELELQNQQLQEQAAELEVQADDLAATAVRLEEQMEEAARTRAALVETERQFRVLADVIPTLAWTARADGYIDWYNARWYAYTGTTGHRPRYPARPAGAHLRAVRAGRRRAHAHPGGHGAGPRDQSRPGTWDGRRSACPEPNRRGLDIYGHAPPRGGRQRRHGRPTRRRRPARGRPATRRRPPRRHHGGAHVRSARDRRGRQASMVAAHAIVRTARAALVARFVPRQSGRTAVAADQQ